MPLFTNNTYFEKTSASHFLDCVDFRLTYQNVRMEKMKAGYSKKRSVKISSKQRPSDGSAAYATLRPC